MRKHFLILMLMALLPLAGWAQSTTLTGKTIFKTPFVYTIVASGSDYANGKANVTVRKNDAEAQTQLNIPETFKETVQGIEYTGEMTLTVVEIEEDGFSNLSNLQKVVIPASVKKIGASAFAGDIALADVTFTPGSQLTEIGEHAFSAWIAEKFDLSKAESLKTLPSKLFLSASASQNQYVKEVVLPASVTDISTALAKLPKLAKVNIAETSIASLKEGALEGNTQITELELPATVKTIADGALKSTKVAKLTINAYQGDDAAAVYKIGTSGNIYGTNTDDLKVLTDVTFKGEFKGTVTGAAFHANVNLANITFDAVSGTIAAGAFTGTDKLATITMGDVKDGANIGAAFATTLEAGAALEMGNIGAATIADGAFTGLNSVKIGNIATTAATGAGAFAGKIASIEIGNITGRIGGSFTSTADAATLKIASIGADAVLADNAFTGKFTSIEITGALNGTVGASFVGSYANGAALKIGSIGDANIAANAFTGLKSVKVGDIATVTNAIGVGAFAGAKLASIEIGNITGQIGGSFTSTADAATLKIASIGATANLADAAFTGKFTSIEITGALNGTVGASFVGSYANGAALTIGSIGDANIAANAFTGLKSVKVGDIATATTQIGAGAFAGKIASIEIGNITGQIGDSFTSTANAATLKIASIGADANLADAAFTGKFTSIEITGALNGTVGASFVGNHGNGAALKIGSIGDANIAANAFTGLKSVKVGDIATVTNAIGAGAFAGDKLVSIETGAITGKIGASFVSTYTGDANHLAGADLKIASIGEGATFDANAFNNINNMVVTNGISGGTFAAGSFVFADVDKKAVNLGNISGGTFTADMITGPTTTTNKLTLVIGNVSSAINVNLLTGSIKEATVGEISAAFAVEAIGAAEKVTFDAVKQGGSITGVSTNNTTLTEANFGAVEVANGITATSFTNFTKLATVNFTGVLVANSVAAASFKTAGNEASSTFPKMTVTYEPADDKVEKAFHQATFGVVTNGRAVKLVTTKKFYEQYSTTSGFFYRVTEEYDHSEDVDIEFKGQAVNGYYYARLYVPATEKAEITKVEGLTVYSAYTDGEDIYMNPLRVYGGKYQINGTNAIRAALIVKNSTNTKVTYKKNANATTKQSIQNADDQYGILYNDGTALTGAQISMEDGANFKLTNGTATKWSDVKADTDHNSIVLISNPEKSNSIKFADFDPDNQPTVKIAAGGYYLLVKKADNAARNVVWLDEDGNTTAIDTIEAAAETVNGANDAIYNLQGVRVSSASQKGIYIQNGKKFVVK